MEKRSRTKRKLFGSLFSEKTRMRRKVWLRFKKRRKNVSSVFRKEKKKIKLRRFWERGRRKKYVQTFLGMSKTKKLSSGDFRKETTQNESSVFLEKTSKKVQTFLEETR